MVRMTRVRGRSETLCLRWVPRHSSKMTRQRVVCLPNLPEGTPSRCALALNQHGPWLYMRGSESDRVTPTRYSDDSMRQQMVRVDLTAPDNQRV